MSCKLFLCPVSLQSELLQYLDFVYHVLQNNSVNGFLKIFVKLHNVELNNVCGREFHFEFVLLSVYWHSEWISSYMIMYCTLKHTLFCRFLIIKSNMCSVMIFVCLHVLTEKTIVDEYSENTWLCVTVLKYPFCVDKVECFPGNTSWCFVIL